MKLQFEVTRIWANIYCELKHERLGFNRENVVIWMWKPMSPTVDYRLKNEQLQEKLDHDLGQAHINSQKHQVCQKCN